MLPFEPAFDDRFTDRCKSLDGGSLSLWGRLLCRVVGYCCARLTLLTTGPLAIEYSDSGNRSVGTRSVTLPLILRLPLGQKEMMGCPCCPDVALMSILSSFGHLVSNKRANPPPGTGNVASQTTDCTKPNTMNRNTRFRQTVWEQPLEMIIPMYCTTV